MQGSDTVCAPWTWYATKLSTLNAQLDVGSLHEMLVALAADGFGC